MGLIGKLLAFTRGTRKGAQVAFTKHDPGGGYNVTSEHFGAPGDDAAPLPGDYVVAVRIPRTGGSAAVAYLDPLNAGEAAPGERRIYARDTNGAPVVWFWLKANGSAILDNGSGSIELAPGGDITLNGVTIDTDGNITSPGIVEGDTVRTAAGIDLGTHTHSGVTTGSGTSGPPTP